MKIYIDRRLSGEEEEKAETNIMSGPVAVACHDSGQRGKRSLAFGAQPLRQQASPQFSLEEKNALEEPPPLTLHSHGTSATSAKTRPTESAGSQSAVVMVAVSPGQTVGTIAARRHDLDQRSDRNAGMQCMT